MNRTHLFAAGPELDADPRAFRPGPCGRLRLYKGGGSAPKNYRGLEALYQEQAASARLLRNQATQYLPEATASYVDKVRDVTDSDYAGRQADMAGADMASANAMEREATTRELQSMGVNPNDARFAGSLRGLETSNAARMAAGKNLARSDAENKQLAVAQDAVGTFTGQSNSAASQMAGASSGLSALANQQNAAKQQAAAQQSANTANAVGGAMAAAGMMSNWRDGGRVTKPAGIKMLERHMLGGAAGAQQGTQQGFFQMQQVAPPPASPQGPQAPTAAGSVMRAAQMYQSGAKTAGAAKRIAAKYQAMKAGANMTPEQAKAASAAYRTAAENATDETQKRMYDNLADKVDKGNRWFGDGEAPAGEAGRAGADAATATPVTDTTAGVETASESATASPVVDTAAADSASGAAESTVPYASILKAGADIADGRNAGEAVADAAASYGGAKAGAALGTAILPGIGTAAGAIIGGMLGGMVFADGGKVEKPAKEQFSAAFNDDPQTIDGRDGGAVSGPGNHLDDIVPAILSNGEGVLTGEAMALGGEAVMEDLNKRGLELRRRGFTPDQIRGLKAAMKKKEAA